MSIRTSTVRLAAIAILAAGCGSAMAGGRSIDRTGPHGSTVTGSTSQQGNQFSGNATATGARGNTVSGDYSGAVTVQGATAQGEVTGP